MTDTAQHFRERAERFAEILEACGEHWDAPSPCEGWAVRDVVEHVVETERDFLARMELDPGPAPDLSDPAAGWRTHLDAVTAVLSRDGVAGREYDGWFGRTTVGATMADFYGWDLVIHGSDVARATGQPWSISDEEAAALEAAADGWGDSLYAEGICAAPVPVGDDASAGDRLLARLGRDPGWRPQARTAS